MSVEEQTDAEVKSLWIFGYGSLTWKPNMAYSRREIGYIRGFKRRFWQGSTTHRGTRQRPGRVATMIQDPEAVLWGAAFQITGEDSIATTLRDLNNRESILGGYRTYYLPFICRDEAKTNDECFNTDGAQRLTKGGESGERETTCDHEQQIINVVVYVATPANDMYLGPADVDAMAEQIVGTSGHAGPNTEYVTKLADFTREFIPEDKDDHLFVLDTRVREMMTVKGRLVRKVSVNCANDNDIVEEMVQAGCISANDLIVPNICDHILVT